MVLVYIGETPSRDATPNETVSVLSELARQSSAAAGGDPRACWTPQDMMRQSRSSHDSRRIILAWFEGDVSGAPVTEDGVPVLAVAEEGIGIYSEYVAPMPVPDEVIDSGKVDGRVTAFVAVSCSLTSRASQATIFLMPFDLDGEVAEILVAAAEDVARSWGRTELTLVLDEVRGDEIPCEVSQMSVASSPANEAARRRCWHLAQVTRCSGAAIPPAD